MRPEPAIESLRAQIEKIEGKSRRVKSVLPFGIAEVDSRLPGEGLALGALHEIAGGGNGAIDGAAAALFAEKGYAHTTLQDIIDATGLSKGAVYHHFQSKEEIAARVGDRLGTRVTGELARIRDDAALTGLQKLQAVFAVCLVPQRQQTLQRALPRLWDDPQFLSIELHDLLEKTIPLYLEPMVRQGTADGSIHTPDPSALCEALFLLADLWLNPQTRPTTPARQRARCAVFQQMTQALGLDLLTDEQSEELAALCEAE